MRFYNSKTPLLKLKIRVAKKKDTGLLAALGRKTFYQTYAKSHSKKDMSCYLKENFSKKHILTCLQNKNNLFLIAFINDIPLGYAKLSAEKKCPALKKANAIELERIYVLKNATGKKTGTALMKKAIKIACKKKCAVIWLSVWEHNPKAISFYRKFGFRQFAVTGFMLGRIKRKNFLMKKNLAALS
ncbi:MAG: GNAT family N-acetyltransferase [Candidatus Omnitrophica bacterium]|nr:GNAT family N-acetyltransferase [Candidatus Omnitrophota bacterium]